MKNKKMVIGTILLLFVISGLCNVISVYAPAPAPPVELPPLSYLYYDFDVDYRDKLEISISSNGTVNVYIMEKYQFDLLVDSGGLIWDYIKRWQDVLFLDYTYTIPYTDEYYVVIYNKNVLFGRTVEVELKIIYYVKPIFIGFIIAGLAGLVVSIVLPIVLVKRSKRKKREAGTQYQEMLKPKSWYCSKCGAENTDMTRDYCSKCGSKIKR